MPGRAETITGDTTDISSHAKPPSSPTVITGPPAADLSHDSDATISDVDSHDSIGSAPDPLPALPASEKPIGTLTTSFVSRLFPANLNSIGQIFAPVDASSSPSAAKAHFASNGPVPLTSIHFEANANSLRQSAPFKTPCTDSVSKSTHDGNVSMVGPNSINDPSPVNNSNSIDDPNSMDDSDSLDDRNVSVNDANHTPSEIDDDPYKTVSEEENEEENFDENLLHLDQVSSVSGIVGSSPNTTALRFARADSPPNTIGPTNTYSHGQCDSNTSSVHHHPNTKTYPLYRQPAINNDRTPCIHPNVSIASVPQRLIRLHQGSLSNRSSFSQVPNSIDPKLGLERDEETPSLRTLSASLIPPTQKVSSSSVQPQQPSSFGQSHRVFEHGMPNTIDPPPYPSLKRRHELPHEPPAKRIAPIPISKEPLNLVQNPLNNPLEFHGNLAWLKLYNQHVESTFAWTVDASDVDSWSFTQYRPMSRVSGTTLRNGSMSERGPGVLWTAAEKLTFFKALARYSVHRLDDIAAALPQKSKYLILAYYHVLRDALRQQKRKAKDDRPFVRVRYWDRLGKMHFHKRPFTLLREGQKYSDLPIAYEVSEAFIKLEEQQALYMQNAGKTRDPKAALYGKSSLLLHSQGLRLLQKTFYRNNHIVAGPSPHLMDPFAIVLFEDITVHLLRKIVLAIIIEQEWKLKRKDRKSDDGAITDSDVARVISRLGYAPEPDRIFSWNYMWSKLPQRLRLDVHYKQKGIMDALEAEEYILFHSNLSNDLSPFNKLLTKPWQLCGPNAVPAPSFVETHPLVEGSDTDSEAKDDQAHHMTVEALCKRASTSVDEADAYNERLEELAFDMETQRLDLQDDAESAFYEYTLLTRLAMLTAHQDVDLYSEQEAEQILARLEAEDDPDHTASRVWKESRAKFVEYQQKFRDKQPGKPTNPPSVDEEEEEQVLLEDQDYTLDFKAPQLVDESVMEFYDYEYATYD